MAVKTFFPRPRKIPFDMSKCLAEYTSPRQLVEEIAKTPYGLVGAMTLMGASVAVEYMEVKLAWMHKMFSAFGEDDVAKNFVRQEHYHSGYHHILNRFLTPGYSVMEHSGVKVNDIAASVFNDATVFEKMVHPRSDQELADVVRAVSLQLAAFEVSIGIFNSFTMFEIFEENSDIFLSTCPFFSYLWLYHSAEEMEHVHVAVNSFEAKYGDSIFSKENIGHLNREVDRFNEQANEITLRLSVNFGLAKMWDDPAVLASGILREKVKSVRSRYQAGTKLDDIADLRERYISAFDTKWGPQLQEAVLLRLKKSA